ncbi:interferon regulatory factor 3 isoform X2 [Fukomys damarensis]|uniref:interferon regulatory factor 3 isoform X2 n=1 Tax=Fukomys damarensis TaxID=885580 RepID=UPI0014550D91|nr:interferon regulatory factor 3 isoform X2 [Fukomys damarensis]
MARAAGRTLGAPKPRILPWLVSKLDQGELEGVAWLDRRRKRFRIPWKHGLRQDAQLEDFGIFQAWAEASGAYIPGRDEPDLPTWKRNFRSALNRKEVLRLVEDRSKDPHDPHKVYEFVHSGARDSSQLDTSPETNEGGSTCDTQEDILELLSDMVLVPPPDDRAPEQCAKHVLSPNLDNPVPCPNPAPSDNPLKQLLVSEERECQLWGGGAQGARWALTWSLLISSLSPSLRHCCCRCYRHSEWEFEVTAFYRGHQVFQQTIFPQGGLRLVGSESGNWTLPGHPITLPDPEVSLSDQGVKGYVRRVLSSLGGGLALWRAGQRLYARRLGHCHAYWAMGEELLPDCEHGHKGEVTKDMDSNVFDLGPFVADSRAPRSDCLHGRKWTLATLHSLVLPGRVMAPEPAVGQEACDGQGCSHLPQGPVKLGPGRGGLLTREHRGLAHFQQPTPVPHLRPVQGLPAGPG